MSALRVSPRPECRSADDDDWIDASELGGILQPVEVCSQCGDLIAIGDSPSCKDGHASVLPYHPFIPYFDFALGEYVSSHAARWTHMKRLHMDYRDKMSPGDLSARLDRIADQKRAQARA